MPCPTCNATMQGLAMRDGRETAWFWCPRCGTLKSAMAEATGVEGTEAPSLVCRVRRAATNATLALSETPRISFCRISPHLWRDVREAIGLPPEDN